MFDSTTSGTTQTTALAFQSPYDTFRWAEELFARRDYIGAARLLADLVAAHPDDPGLGSARELLARSYFHSAQLERAAATAREVLALRPTDAYMAHLLTRSLERSARHDEADSVRPLARALGAEIA